MSTPPPQEIYELDPPGPSEVLHMTGEMKADRTLTASACTTAMFTALAIENVRSLFADTKPADPAAPYSFRLDTMPNGVLAAHAFGAHVGVHVAACVRGYRAAHAVGMEQELTAAWTLHVKTESATHQYARVVMTIGR